MGCPARETARTHKVDKGKGKSVTSTTLTKDVYAFIFNQKGLMAGAGIQGSKITKVSQ